MTLETKLILETMQQNAKENGYFLCPDSDLLQSLIEGLAKNEQRYGYGSCPCRMSSGNKTYDSDIICPCEYRDADVNEFGMCYCGLFVNKAIKETPSKMQPIPERRPIEIQDAAMNARVQKKKPKEPSLEKLGQKTTKIAETTPVWRCTVCGYLCARDSPPPICPICKAKAERFERFSVNPG
jgi:ferredoxin-thioredoxin reductase catalytic subunit